MQMTNDKTKKERIKEKNRKASKNYYARNRNKILNKLLGNKKRICLWCKISIKRKRPRHVKFCSDLHKEFYYREYKRLWEKRKRTDSKRKRAEKLKMSVLAKVQCPPLPASSQTKRNEIAGRTEMSANKQI